jgi:hypothetical protein
MPLCPQITNTPITVSLTADYTVTNVIPVLPATTEQLAVTDAAAALALAEAAAAAAASATALQVSSNTIVNASNQMTAMNGNGITVYSGASATSGARVVLNSAGLAGFNSSGTSTFAIDSSNGNVSVTGTVNAGAGYFGTPTNGFSINSTGLVGVGTGLISGGSISGATITGGTVQTSTGSAAVILNGASNAIQFRNSSSIVANIVPLSSNGLLMHYGASADPSGGTFPQMFIGASNCSISAAAGNSIGVSTSLGVTFSGAASANSTFTVAGVFTATDAGTNTNTNTPNAWLSTAGILRRSTASSARYKENITDIRDVAELDPKKLLEIPVRAFSYKPEYLKEQDDRAGILMPGLIAEEVDAVYPLAADYEGGNVENINDRAILVNLLALVQDLYKEIALLKGE